MGSSLREISSRAEALFLLADRVTGLPISSLCADGPKEALTQTDVAQTAIVVTSLAAAAVLEETLGAPPPSVLAVAGHSVGELTALCWAGALDLETTLRLVCDRGRLMGRDSAASNGTMAAVLGLEEARLDEICREASTAEATVQIANVNAPGQIVLSGERRAIEAASKLALAAGARRVLPLAVGGPFHSRYMEAASRDFGTLVRSARFTAPRVPVVLNTSAQPTTDPRAIAEELAVQIVSPVRWEATLHRLAGLGCSTFVELGPGQVLTGLVRRTLPEAQATSAGTAESIAEMARLWSPIVVTASGQPGS
jgi:[acyl-carrier-protein] S-malonyltransferase